MSEAITHVVVKRNAPDGTYMYRAQVEVAGLWSPDGQKTRRLLVLDGEELGIDSASAAWVYARERAKILEPEGVGTGG
jgi:hypothetical protein